MRVLQRGDLLGHAHGGPIALESLLGRRAIGDQPLGLHRLLEQGSTLRQRRFGVGPAIARLDEAIPLLLQLGEGRFALLDGREPPGPTAASATFSRPGFFSPFVFSS